MSPLKNAFLSKNSSKFVAILLNRKTLVENLHFLKIRSREEWKSCRSRKMLQIASLLAIVAVDTEENEPIKK